MSDLKKIGDSAVSVTKTSGKANHTKLDIWSLKLLVLHKQLVQLDTQFYISRLRLDIAAGS